MIDLAFATGGDLGGAVLHVLDVRRYDAVIRPSSWLPRPEAE